MSMYKILESLQHATKEEPTEPTKTVNENAPRFLNYLSEAGFEFRCDNCGCAHNETECPHCAEVDEGVESTLGRSDVARKASEPKLDEGTFIPGLPDMPRKKPTKGYRPAIWENMLGTVYAMNDQDKVRYFERDYEAAIKYSGAGEPGRDPRLYKNVFDVRWTDDGGVGGGSGPRKGKLVVWVKKNVSENVNESIEDILKLANVTLSEEKQSYTPPKSAQNNAKKVLKWKEEHGDEVKGMTQTGWTRANQLASGEELSLDTVKRMASFARHKKNAKVSDEHRNEPWKDNGYVAWLGWGGDSGINWAKSVSEKSKDD